MCKWGWLSGESVLSLSKRVKGLIFESVPDFDLDFGF